MKISNIVAETLNRAILFEQAVKNNQFIEGSSSNPIQDAINSLKKLADDEGIAIAIIGGAAAAYHGYPRSTKDVDVVVSTTDFHKIMRVSHEYGFVNLSYNPSKMCEMIYQHNMSPDVFKLPNGKTVRGVLIEVLEEGMMDVPSPTKMGVVKGLGFASLKSWIGMKLKAGRMQDLADVVQVLKKTNNEQQQDIGEYIYDLDESLYGQFEWSLDKAKSEQESDPLKNHRYNS